MLSGKVCNKLRNCGLATSQMREDMLEELIGADSLNLSRFLLFDCRHASSLKQSASGPFSHPHNLPYFCKIHFNITSVRDITELIID